MIFGDPHVQYYLSDDTGPQTCNELDTFTESDGLVANSSVSLMENDFYRISGMFGKFKLNNTGTYLHSVSVLQNHLHTPKPSIDPPTQTISRPPELSPYPPHTISILPKPSIDLSNRLYTSKLEV